MLPRSENLVPLNSGTYQARSYIADSQICINLFPEVNPQETDPTVPITHYPREGLRPLSAPPVAAPGRGIFALSNGQLYAVAGPSVYYIDANWAWHLLGTIANLTTPVSMSDNGTTAVLVDGTPNGYTIDLTTYTFAQLVDGTGTFVGSRRVDFADTFLAFAKPNSNEWYLSNSNQVTFNALAIAAKDSTPDPIQTFAFNIRQMWLFGSRNSEIWFLAGGTPFAYQEWPNIFVPYGCIAPYSLVRSDVDLYWISHNDQGQVIALKTVGQSANAISTRALEYEWTNYPTVADVIGGTFQQAGHTFVIFHFPTADKTWAFDLSTKQWHQRTYLGSDGIQHREKVSFYASVAADGSYPGTIVGQDWQTGQIYALDPKYYTDNGQPIIHRRTFPHIVSDMNFLTVNSFVADFETGDIVGYGKDGTQYGQPTKAWSSAFSAAFGPLFPVGAPTAPMLCMRASKNGGASYGNYRQKGLLGSGEYRSMMRWRGLGMARDWVFDLMWAYPGRSALQGAYVGVIGHGA